jgi:hypothetical protein
LGHFNINLGIFLKFILQKHSLLQKKNKWKFLRIYLRKIIFCGFSSGFTCGKRFPAEFSAAFNAELPADYSQEHLLQFHCHCGQEIPQESFMRISKTAGNNYLQRF